MKLRILDDTLRLRLSQSDVARFEAEGAVEATIHFGSGDDDALVYRLERDETATELHAELCGRVITVRVPAAAAREWTGTGKVGMEVSQPLHEGRRLHILVEKDFKCAIPRAGEEDYDGFPNPGAC